MVRVNNSQLRDSHLDLPPETVTPWYRALRLYNEVMERLSIRLKLNDGGFLVESPACFEVKSDMARFT